MNNLSLTYLCLIFAVSCLLTWLAGRTLTKTTDSLDCRFQIGQAFGGLILLGVAGSLPDIAVAFSAAVHGHTAVIIGELMGGVAIQTLVIVIFDLAVKGKRPLSYLAGSITLFFEAAFAVGMMVLAVLGTYVPAKNSFFHINPFSLIILVAWFVGIYLLKKSHQVKKFNQVEDDANPGRLHDECRVSEKSLFFVKKSNWQVISIFLVASIVILISGVLLEETGTAIAGALGINSGIFAATVFALVTALPEISTGVEAIFIGDNHLALSDIWGGNYR